MRDYISHSQINTFKTSPNDYLRRYLYNEDIMPEWAKKYAEHGKLTHELLENNDPSVEPIKWQVGEYNHRELEIRADLDGITLYGILDLVNDKTQEIADYKTATKPKRQIDVDLDEQITFYCILCELHFGWTPKKATIYRIETAQEHDELYNTGQVDVITTTRTPEIIANYKKEIKRVYAEIQDLLKREQEAVANGAEPLSITKRKSLKL